MSILHKAKAVRLYSANFRLIVIYNISDLEKNVKKSDIKTAILSVRKENAQEVVDTLVKAGIKGFLNFAPIRLKVPSDVVVQSIDLTKELQTLLFFMNDYKQ